MDVNKSSFNPNRGSNELDSKYIQRVLDDGECGRDQLGRSASSLPIQFPFSN